MTKIGSSPVVVTLTVACIVLIVAVMTVCTWLGSAERRCNDLYKRIKYESKRREMDNPHVFDTVNMEATRIQWDGRVWVPVPCEEEEGE